MAKGVKTGGRQVGTNNKGTKELRVQLKELLTKEFSTINQHLNKLEPADRLEFLVKLLPYTLPKYDQIPAEDESKGKQSVKFYHQLNQTLINKGYGVKKEE